MAGTGGIVEKRRRRCAWWLAGAMSMFGAAATAGPWLDPGDTLLRHDIQLLCDAGIVHAPLTTWPLAWADVARDLAGPHPELSPALANARSRVLQRYRLEAKTYQFRPHLRAALSNDPRQFRTFEATTRERAELEAGLEWTGDILAARLQATAVSGPDDGRSVRYDGSYLAALWNNWALSVGAFDRWWGPGWDGSLILSTNARPIPSLTVQRHLSDPFDNDWLRWLGPWQLLFSVGQLEHDRDVPDALFMGMRFAFRPVSALEIGLSRTAQWGGQGRPEDLSTFGDLLLGRDNTGSAGITAANEPGNQLGGLDVRWQSPLFDAPYALYAQVVGEDEAGGLPSKDFAMAGIETWGAWGERGASWRVRVEYADTAVNGFLGDPAFNTTYRHHIYSDGYTYRGRIIGHSFGGDGRSLSAGVTLITERGRPWEVLLRRIEPDRDNAASPTVMSAEISHRIIRGDHDIALRAAGVRSEGPAGNDNDAQFDIEWRRRY